MRLGRPPGLKRTLKLHAIDPQIPLAALQQLRMRANIRDPPVLEHHNLVCPQNRAQSMSNRNHRPVLGQFIQIILNLRLRFTVQSRRRFIQ